MKKRNLICAGMLLLLYSALPLMIYSSLWGGTQEVQIWVLNAITIVTSYILFKEILGNDVDAILGCCMYVLGSFRIFCTFECYDVFVIILYALIPLLIFDMWKCIVVIKQKVSGEASVRAEAGTIAGIALAFVSTVCLLIASVQSGQSANNAGFWNHSHEMGVVRLIKIIQKTGAYPIENADGSLNITPPGLGIVIWLAVLIMIYLEISHRSEMDAAKRIACEGILILGCAAVVPCIAISWKLLWIPEMCFTIAVVLLLGILREIMPEKLFYYRTVCICALILQHGYYMASVLQTLDFI